MRPTPPRDPKRGLSGAMLIGVLAALGLLVVVLGRSVLFPTSTASGTAAQVGTTVPSFDPYPIVPTWTPGPTIDVPTPTPGDPFPTLAAIPPSSPVPTPQPGDPYQLRAWGLVDTWEPEELTKRVPLVVVGTVTKVYPARWTTPDGARPKNPHSSDNTHTIYTPAEVTVTEFLKGEQHTAQLMLRVDGGVVGQDSVTIDPPEVLKEGEQVMLFLYPDRRKLSFKNVPMLEVSARFTITTDGKLMESPKDLSLDEAIRAIRLVEQ